MLKPLEHYLPADIERSSMAIICAELKERGIRLPEENAAVICRAIHTTADFDYAENLTFTENAVQRGVDACTRGRVIVTDSNMALSGISKGTLEKLEMKAVCLTGEREAELLAREKEVTRAAAGMMLATERFPEAFFVTGNAPTALLTIVERMEEGLRPALLVGVPVGFVNVVESKEEALRVSREKGVPSILAMGRKGGSNVAAAIMNAILYTASHTLDPSERGWMG